MPFTRTLLLIGLLSCATLVSGQWVLGIDPDFGNNGLTTWDHGGNVSSRPVKVFRRNDGSTVVVGMNIDASNQITGPFTALLDPSGQRDLGYGRHGETEFEQLIWNGLWYRLLIAAAMQSDGRVIMILYDQNSGLTQLVRVLPTGYPDPSFGPNGAQAVVGIDINTIAVQPDDGILLLGSSGGNATVRRLLASGALDTSFGTGGSFVASVTDSFRIVEFLASGKMLVGGTGLARLNANGTLDTSFGTNGWSAEPFVSAFPWINDLAELPNGMVLLGKDTGIRRLLEDGTALDADFTFNNTWPFGALHIEAAPDGSWYFFNSKLRRVDANDQLDPSFGEVDLSLGETLEFTYSEGDGVDVFGFMVNAEPFSDDVAIERYDLGGDAVTAWGRNGRMVCNGNGGNENVTGLAVASDGYIWTVGPGYQAGPMMARFQPNGAPDLGFGYSGAADPIMNRPIAVGVRSDGTAVVAGSNIVGNSSWPVATLVLADGSTDAFWNTNAGVTGTTNGIQQCADMIVLPDDRTAVLINMGDISNPTPEHCAIVMLSADGQRDLSFGTDGQVLFGWDGVSVSGIAMLPNGGLLCIGTEYINGEVKLFSYAVDASGQPFGGFGTNGAALVTLPQTSFYFTSVRPVVRPDGSYYVLYDDTSFGWLSRLQPDGSLDLSFNNGYYALPDFQLGRGMGLLSTDELLVSCYEYWGTLPLLKFGADGALVSSFGDGGVYTIADTAMVKFGNSVLTVLPGDTVLLAGDLRRSDFWESEGIDPFLFRFDPDFNVSAATQALPEGLLCFPSPSAGRVFIRLNETEHMLSVMLVDDAGRSIPAEVQRQSEGFAITMPPDAAPGAYMLRLGTPTGARVARFVLQR
ncbi:MAG: hypothetical protein IPK70_01765 [Flavobacteriales bacterium]|nr:hypothetical protein [Flavobacteriales bacterium]